MGGVRSKVFLKNWKHLLAKANRVLLKAEPFNLHILNTDLKWPVSTGVLQSAQQKVAARKESDPAAIDVPTQKFNLRPESMTKERVMPPDVVLKKATKVRDLTGEQQLGNSKKSRIQTGPHNISEQTPINYMLNKKVVFNEGARNLSKTYCLEQEAVGLRVLKNQTLSIISFGQLY